MDAFIVQIISGKGRAAIASRPFAVGEIIFEEEPFVSCQFAWNEAYGYAACDHCMRPLETVVENVRRLANNQTLVVPYPECDSTTQWQFTSCLNCQVRYCSEDCRIEATKYYHRASCLGVSRHDDSHPINILKDIWKKMHYPPETGSIMLIVRLMAMYKQSAKKEKFLETLQSFQSTAVNVEQQICHKMLGENFEVQLEQLYIGFCNAFRDEEFAIFKTPDAFKSLLALIGTNSQGVATSVLAEWVKRVSNLALPDADKLKLEQHITDLYNKIDEFVGEYLNNEGSGLYILQSKINHSCVPNAQSTFPYSNDIVVLKAIEPIQAGDEICISYLDECQLERSRHSRQRVLRENYIFQCNCPKCQTQANDPDETSEDEDEFDDEMETESVDSDMES